MIRIRLFQYAVIAIFILFMAVMVGAVATAFSRSSGALGLSMGRVHELRVDAGEVR